MSQARKTAPHRKLQPTKDQAGSRIFHYAVTRKSATAEIKYGPNTGFGSFVQRVSHATPMEILKTERAGVHAQLIKDLSSHMAISASRMFRILGIPKATAEKKLATGQTVSGQSGQAAIGIVKLLGMAETMMADSTSQEAKGFDSAKWLGRWIETPQPALGGQKPADLLDTPTGLDIVSRLLGAIQSGAYQ